jgi:hypothetical protein
MDRTDQPLGLETREGGPEREATDAEAGGELSLAGEIGAGRELPAEDPIAQAIGGFLGCALLVSGAHLSADLGEDWYYQSLV